MQTGNGFIAVKVIAAANTNYKGFKPINPETVDKRPRELLILAPSLEAAIARARIEGWKGLSAELVDTKVPNGFHGVRYNMCIEWMRYHEPTGDFRQDTYLVGLRCLEIS